VPNKYYYDQSKIHWGKVVTKSITDPNAGLAALRSGQIDVLELAAPTTAREAAALGLRVVLSRGGSNRGIMWTAVNGKPFPPLGDLRVRQALSYALNKKTYLALKGPGAVPTSTPFPSSIQLAGPKYANYYTYNPAKARALLAAAGYPDGFTMPIISLGPWLGPAYDESPLCYAIAKDLAAVGVKMTVSVPGAADFGNDLGSGKYAGVCISFSGRQSPWVWYQYLRDAHGPSFLSGGISDPVAYRLYLKAARLPYDGAGYAVWRQLTRRVITQAETLFVLRTPIYTFVSKRVSGVRPAVGIFGLGDPIDWYPTG
jgi:peptide/nickel transport system substrate-binding protein